jgi:lysophospholipase L1-like esterase
VAIAGFLLATVGALTLLFALAGIGDAQSPPRTYYVSLGDSLARGWQPGSDGRTRMTNRGYVDAVGSYLAGQQANLLDVKFGCGGETTVTIMRGGICSYPTGSELAEAERFLRSHRGRVAAVTVNIGDNDVEHCLANGTVDSACVNRTMAGVRTRLPAIAQRLMAAAGPGVKIVGLTDYDQFLAYWLRGAAGRKFARQSILVVKDLNDTADGIYRTAGIRVADATGAFATTDLTTRDALPGHGRQPRAVVRVCRWTWACSSPPIGFNDHANDTGYRVLGRVVIGALRG